MDEYFGFDFESKERENGVSMDANCASFGRTVFPYAMAYIPRQNLTAVYPETKALERGTLFPELDKPFLAAK